MGRRYLGYDKNQQMSEKTTVTTHNGHIRNINKQATNGCRVILLDSALKLKLKPPRTDEKPKINASLACQRQANRTVFELNAREPYLEPTRTDKNSNSNEPLMRKRQANRTVMELNANEPLNCTNKRQKVNFVDFIDSSKVKIERNDQGIVNANPKLRQIQVKQEYSEETSSESNKNTSKSLVLVQDNILKTSDNKIVRISTKPVFNLIPGVIKKAPFIPIMPKETSKQVILKTEVLRHIIKLEKQALQVETQPLKSTESPAVQSSSSIDRGKISEVLKNQQLLDKHISLRRVIKLHPLNLKKLSQRNQKRQLSNILKTVIKNNLTNELQQNQSKEAYPVALKSYVKEDIRLLNFNPTSQSSEQILGI